MINLAFGSADLLQVRFAISPAEEVLGVVRTLADPGRHAYHLPWLRRVRQRARELNIAALAALVTAPDYTPDFLSPPPSGPLCEFGEQLDRLLATPRDQVEHEVRLSVGDRPVPPELAPVLADPSSGAHLLAEQLRATWQALLEPDWLTLHDILDADIFLRARRLGDSGARAVFDELHPQVRWHAGSIKISGTRGTTHRELAGKGLVLVPSVFGWPKVQVMLVPPWQPTLVYPARGIDALWRRSARDPALQAALGRTRSILLTDLAEPSTTATLARRHQLAPSTVSEHLAALRSAGLLSSRRSGRSVYYELTALGYALTRQHDPATKHQPQGRP